MRTASEAFFSPRWGLPEAVEEPALEASSASGRALGAVAQAQNNSEMIRRRRCMAVSGRPSSGF